MHAFVIMPFDAEFDAVYKDLLAKPLEDSGYIVRRADDVNTRQNVLADVVRGIAEADLLVADLTTLNPNVFYELGIAHGMGVPTVLVAHQDSSGDIPFDLRQYRTEFYDTHFQRAGAIIEALQKLGVEHAAEKVPFGSPISDFLPGAAKPTIRRHRTVATTTSISPSESREIEKVREPQESDDDDAEEGDRGLIEYVEEMNAAAEEFGEVTDRFNKATEATDEQITVLAEQMEAVDGNSPQGQAQMKRLLLQMAALLDDYSDHLETDQQRYEQVVERITANGLGYITLLASHADQYKDELESTLEASRSLRDTASATTESMVGLREAVRGLPPLLGPTIRARDRAVRALGAVLAQQERVRSYAEQSVGLAENALAGLSPEHTAETKLYGSESSGEAP
jgi:hypothetical protein